MFVFAPNMAGMSLKLFKLVFTVNTMFDEEPHSSGGEFGLAPIK
jgi:hypothetical protein